MILAILIVSILIACNADVSHLGTDFREDGYHYKQPLQPFPPENTGTDNQLGYDVSHEKVDKPYSRVPVQRPSAPTRPTPEYLPPAATQPASKPTNYPQPRPHPQAPTKDYDTDSTYDQQPQPEPTQEYGVPKAVPSAKPRQEYIPPRASPTKPQSFSPTLKFNGPEREYLPPDENEISSEENEAYPGPQPTISAQKYPARQPTYTPPASTVPAEPTDKASDPSYLAPQTTYQTPQSTYLTPESTFSGPESTILEFQSTFPVPRPTYIAPQPSYTESKAEPTSSGPTPQPEEPEPAHELGPDGYKYKVPSNSFNY